MLGYATFTLLFAKDIDIIRNTNTNIANIFNLRHTARMKAILKGRRRRDLYKSTIVYRPFVSG
jgi:hypothetical protein